MAQLSEDNSDKALWLTLAQSWVRLAEHVALAKARPDAPGDLDNVVELRAPDRD